MLFVLPAADTGYRIFLLENEADVTHGGFDIFTALAIVLHILGCGGKN